MNFSRVKLIIILCLAVFNVLLGLLCVRLVYDNSYISEEETALAQKHLSKIGLNVKFESDLRKKHTLPIYSVDVSSDGEAPEVYQSITEAFFDASVNSEDYVTIPGGYSISVKDKDGRAMGTSTLADSMIFECAYENTLTDTDVQRISIMYYSSDAEMSENKNAEKIAERFVGKSFRGFELDYVKKGCSVYNGGHIVYFVGSVSDTEILDLYVNVFVKDGKPLYCIGSIIDSTPERKYSSKLIDSVNILYCLAELRDNDTDTASSGITVTGMTMTYKMLESDAFEYYLIPTWLISYTDEQGRGKTVAIDAIVGENKYALKS